MIDKSKLDMTNSFDTKLNESSEIFGQNKCERLINKYIIAKYQAENRTSEEISKDINLKEEFLRMAIEFVEKMTNFKCGKFSILKERLKIVSGKNLDSDLVRDIKFKCRSYTNISLLFLLLKKKTGQSLEIVFKKHLKSFKNLVESLSKLQIDIAQKEEISAVKSLSGYILEKESAWDSWKQNKCEGIINYSFDHKTKLKLVNGKGSSKLRKNQISKSSKKFREIESQDLDTKIVEEENNAQTVLNIKRTSGKSEMARMRIWLSMKQNDQLCTNLETEDIWVDKTKLGMNFNVMLKECLKSNQIKKIMKHFKENKKDLGDDYVKWRMFNRIIDGGLWFLAGDYEADFYEFLKKNPNCFENTNFGDHLIAIQGTRKQENEKIQAKNQKLKDFRAGMGINEDGSHIAYCL